MTAAQSIDFGAVNRAALAQAERLLPNWLPGGRFEGREYVAGSLNGGPGRSLSINRTSGVWKDFAEGESAKGGDFVSLYAATHNLSSQAEAARKLAEEIGLAHASTSQPTRVKSQDKPGRQVASYDYHSTCGALAFQVVRYEPKTFRQRRPDGRGGWLWNLQDIELVPYRLPGVLKAKDVFVVEGEKDADALAALGLTATCNAQGAGKWRESYNSHFEGKRVFILPDADEPGLKHAETVARELRKVAVVVKVIELPGLAPKGDVSDWLAGGGSKDALLALAQRQAPWEQAAEARPETKTKPGLVVVNAGQLLSLELPERNYVLWPVIPTQGLAMLYAPRGVGKTFAALSISYAVASGQKVFRWEAPQPQKVLYLDGEMPAKTMQERLASIVAGFERELPGPEWLKIITPDLQADAMPDIASQEGQAALEPHLEGVSLVVVDNLATLARSGRENEAEGWRTTQSWLLGLRRRGFAVLLIHHAGKGGQQRGTSSREDILDTVISLRRPNDYRPEQGARFEFVLEKARGICGDDAKGFEAQLEMTNQALVWHCRDIEDVKAEQVKRLLADGAKVNDIAEELGVSRATAYRLANKVKAQEGARL